MASTDSSNKKNDIFGLACNLFCDKLEQNRYTNSQELPQSTPNLTKSINDSNVSINELSNKKFVLSKEMYSTTKNKINQEPTREQVTQKNIDTKIS